MDNKINTFELLYENLKTKIPKDLSDLLKSTRVRKEMLKKYGKTAFLDPKDLKFPVINPNTGNLDCRLIYAAYFRSTIHAKRGGSSKQPKEYYLKIQAAALKLYDGHECYHTLKVQLDHEINDLLTFTRIFEDDINSQSEFMVNKLLHILVE